MCFLSQSCINHPTIIISPALELNSVTGICWTKAGNTPWIGHHSIAGQHTYRHTIESLQSTVTRMFSWLWEETGATRENRSRYRENMQIPQRKDLCPTGILTRDLLAVRQLSYSLFFLFLAQTFYKLKIYKKEKEQHTKH